MNANTLTHGRQARALRAGHLGDPGSPGPRDGDRAPPRGVDVKPSPGPPAQGLPGAWEAQTGFPDLSGRAPRDRGPGGLRNPEPGSPPPGGRGTPILGFQDSRSRDRTRPAPRGGFYINPSRRGPVPGRTGSGDRGPGDSQEASQEAGSPLPARPGKDPFLEPPPKPGTGPRREGLM